MVFPATPSCTCAPLDVVAGFVAPAAWLSFASTPALREASCLVHRNGSIAFSLFAVSLSPLQRRVQREDVVLEQLNASLSEFARPFLSARHKESSSH